MRKVAAQRLKEERKAVREEKKRLVEEEKARKRALELLREEVRQGQTQEMTQEIESDDERAVGPNKCAK